MLNRFPVLHTNYDENYLVPSTNSQVKDKKSHKGDSRVIAGIENNKKWKLNLYQSQSNDDQDINNYLKVGDACWLNLSERNHYLTGSLEKDPFRRNFEDAEKIVVQNSHSSNPPKITWDATNPELSEAVQLNNISISSLEDNNDDSNGEKNYENNFYQKQIISNTMLKFEETLTKKTGKSTEYVDMATNGLWKIEPQNIFEGGYLTWDKPYKFRHLTSGKYLKAERKADGVNISVKKLALLIFVVNYRL